MSALLSKWILDAVDRWADGYVLLREFSLDESIGRFDGLLVPVDPYAAHCMRSVKGEWVGRARLVGVEVKTNRNDFLRGLRTGQFERYNQALSGLYVATRKNVCKTAELPPTVGHLVVWHRRGDGWVAVCRRHPKYRDQSYPAKVPWLLLFRLYREFQERERDSWRERHRIREKIGEEAGLRIFRVLKLIEERAIAEVAEVEAATCG